MSLPKDRISFLLEAYTSKTATAQQEQELMEWVQEAREDSELKNYMQSQWDKYQPTTHFNNVNWDSMFEDIMQKEKVHSIIPEPKRINWTRIAAAAVILLFLSVGGYFILNDGTQKQIAKTETQVQRFKNDVPPGGNKAILTLANGSQIILDSAANGTLTQQGNTKVIKLDSGQLSYREAGSSPLGEAGVRSGSEVFYNTISTPKGGQYQIILADGSKVWLNAASSLKFPTSFAGKERNVELMGEGYFEITKNAAMPFHVKVNDMQVEVLGTHFNINAYSDEAAIKTTLLEGSVKVSKGSATKMLKPGEQARIDNHGNPLIPKIMVQTVNVDEAVAWKNGLFSLNKTDMQTFMRMISRWYDVDVIYEGGIPKGTISGEAQRSLSFAQMQKVLQLTDVHFRIEGKKLIVTH